MKTLSIILGIMLVGNAIVIAFFLGAGKRRSLPKLTREQMEIEELERMVGR